MPEQWQIAGDYVEACNCDVACQCIWLEPPDDDECTVSFGWHIREGSYGNVDLGGQSVGMLVHSDPGVMFGEGTKWQAVLFVDESASDDQRRAIEDIYLGRAGGIWAAIADAHVESAEVVMADVAVDREGDSMSVTVDDGTLAMDVEGVMGFNGDVGTITPHPLTSTLLMSTGRSTTASVDFDDKFTWDVAGGNAYFGDFELANA